MPSTILAPRACAACDSALLRTRANQAVHLVAGHGFSVSRRDRWLIIWDLEEGSPHAFRLELRNFWDKQGRARPRYRLRARRLRRHSRLWEVFEAAGLFNGNESARSGDGYLYLNRIVAAVGGLFTRDGFDSLSWIRKRSRKMNRVVHHRNHDTTDDRFTNLFVMREDDHDKSHDREAVHAACFLPVAVRLKEVNPQVVKTRPIAVQEGTKACVPDHRDRGSEVYRSDAVEIWARTTNQTLGSGSFSTSSEPFSPRPESPRYPVSVGARKRVNLGVSA